MDELENQINELLKKNNAKLGYGFKFPHYDTLPIEADLALKILHKYGMKVVITIDPLVETL